MIKKKEAGKPNRSRMAEGERETPRHIVENMVWATNYLIGSKPNAI